MMNMFIRNRLLRQPCQQFHKKLYPFAIGLCFPLIFFLKNIKMRWIKYFKTHSNHQVIAKHQSTFGSNGEKSKTFELAHTKYIAFISITFKNTGETSESRQNFQLQ